MTTCSLGPVGWVGGGVSERLEAAKLVKEKLAEDAPAAVAVTE